MEANEIESLKKLHLGDVKTIWKIYQKDETFYKNIYFVLSLVISILFSLTTLFAQKTSFEFIDNFVPIIISIVPSLLGFNLGAYILIVGFGSIEILNDLSEPISDDNDYSMYQRLISIMSISVIIQILTLIISVIIVSIVKLEIDPFLNLRYLLVINSLILFVLFFLLIYSILNMINIVKHVFLFAQTIHFVVTINKKNAKKKIIEEQN